MDLAELHEAEQRCERCELFGAATQAVSGEGPSHARLVMIGEQPGDREDQEGRPFVGPAGRVLADASAEAGLGASYLTNAVKHFRFELRGKRRIHQTPLRRHVLACRPWLEAELEAVRPVGVVLLGSTAGQAIYGPGFRVRQARGAVRAWPEPGGPQWSVATIHPSAVLRAREEREAAFAGLVADLQVAARALDERS